ncbi:uncharacterized protein EMH_0005690 [Eimeria mitis]|uniref:Uncharacterized protein n=1 Tax=Eimeria mitis TaxID=44415 RepID=U6KFN5_9EIME|nr:uncharacterized protein EMH_0005690 [Eimeria mitis]CDJ35596.1 hypothetical protein, conserved [Eimeria mitis]
MILPPDVTWRGDVGVTYADPDEVLDPCAFSVAYPLYSVDSELSTEASNRQWSCRLLPCLPPLGLVSASLGLQLGAAFLLLAAASNGKRLHGLQPSLIDPELPAIYIYLLQRDPKTYAWCCAYVFAWLLLIFCLLATGATAVAVVLGCCKWARVMRGLSIVQAFICLATAATCGAWLSGWAVAQSGWRTASVAAFLAPFNYGTLLFAKTHEPMIRAAGIMLAAATGASCRASRATCHDTAVGATVTCFAIIVSWAVSFLLLQGAIGGMAPPIFGVPSALLSFICLLSLNFGCFGRWRLVVLMGLFGASAFVAFIAWSAAQETYTINYSNRAHSDTPLVAQLKRLVDVKQWARALGNKLGVASLVQLAAAQAVLCLFAAVIMFGRAFGDKLEACKRKRRQKKRDKAICEAIHQAANHPHAHPHPHTHAVIESYTEPVFDASPTPPQLPLPVSLSPASLQPTKILVPPPPHAVLP